MAILGSMSAGLRWTLASIGMLLLFPLPILNGVLCGFFAAWPAKDRAENHAASVWAALALVPLLWIANLYPAVNGPLAMMPGFLRVVLSLLAMLATSTIVAALRTSHAVRHSG
jgi:hypothetical protein